MLEIIRSILERKVWDALLLEKFKSFFKKEEYGNTYCYVDETLRQCLENQLVKKIVNFKL